jgi:hypothetical protein
MNKSIGGTHLKLPANWMIIPSLDTIPRNLIYGNGCHDLTDCFSCIKTKCDYENQNNRHDYQARKQKISLDN